MKKLLFSALTVLTSLPTFSRDFAYDYKGHSLSYTVIDEDTKTVMLVSCPKSSAGDLEIPPKVSDGNALYKVTSIGENALRDCSDLISITIPEGVTSIGNGAFYNCKSLSSITIPEGVSTISWDLFNSCSNLTTISLPASITSIESQAFSYCSRLTSINIPEGVTVIGGWVFYGCSSLATINLPDSISLIGFEVFGNCSSLTSINIPKSITFISEEAFSGCTSLKAIYYLADKPIEGNPNIFSEETYEKATLYLTKDGMMSGSSTDPWKNFKNRR